MWIKRSIYDTLRNTTLTLERLAKQYYDAIAQRDVEIKRLAAREIELLQQLGAKLAITAQATAVADLWRTRVNELTIERAKLLEKLVPGLVFPVPIVERTPTTVLPGVDFEDMGDAAAVMSGALSGDEAALRSDPDVPLGVKGIAGIFTDPAEAGSDEL